MTRHKKAGDDGFSLIELLVVITLISVIATISMTAYKSYARSQAHRGGVREVVAILRNTQIKAVTEETTYQCVFGTTTLDVYRDSATPPSASNKTKSYTLDANLQFTSVSFSHEAPGLPASNCFFFARGSADPGSLNVKRIDTNKIFTLKVEGLTARVCYENCS
ncbi:MAG: Tfp pilus assembly protein FimT/FimU [Actinomycetota bacterium]